MFAHPIWFIFRFTFVISFFLILIASRNLEYINKLRLTTNKKILLSTIFIILIELSALYKFKFNLSRELENTYLGYFLIYSMTIFIIYIFNINKKTHLIYTLFFLLFLIDISINTINTQYNNTYDAANVNIKLSKKYNKIINSIKSKDNSFYRITIKKNKVDELLNAGLSYDYYEIDHMSSIRNNNINRFLTSTGLNGLSDYAIITFENYDDSILNLYGIKYIINDDGSKYSTINNNLGLGFTVSENTKNIKLAPNNFYGDNLNRLYSSFINMNSSFYELINYKDFMIYDNKYEKKATYNFVADDNYIIHTGNVIYNLEIDNKKYSYKDKGTSFTVNKGERIKITYKFDNSINKKNIHLILFNLDKYDQVIRKLNNTTDKLYNIKINKNNHIISGEIDVKGDYKYLFTTIGYEKGMKIYVDGKNVEPDLISDAVIGLKLTKGHHEIIIDYIPKGLVIGLITTLFGIVGTLYIIKRKKS